MDTAGDPARLYRQRRTGTSTADADRWCKGRTVDLLPYHTLGVPKWAELGLSYELGDITPPGEETMRELRKLIDAKLHKK